MPTQAACDRYYSFDATPSPQSVPSVTQSTPVAEYYPEFEDDAAFHSDEEIQKVGLVVEQSTDLLCACIAGATRGLCSLHSF